MVHSCLLKTIQFHRYCGDSFINIVSAISFNFHVVRHYANTQTHKHTRSFIWITQVQLETCSLPNRRGSKQPAGSKCLLFEFYVKCCGPDSPSYQKPERMFSHFLESSLKCPTNVERKDMDLLLFFFLVNPCLWQNAPSVCIYCNT